MSIACKGIKANLVTDVLKYEKARKNNLFSEKYKALKMYYMLLAISPLLGLRTVLSWDIQESKINIDRCRKNNDQENVLFPVFLD